MKTAADEKNESLKGNAVIKDSIVTQHTVKQAVSPGHIFSFPLKAGCTTTNYKTKQRNLNPRAG